MLSIQLKWKSSYWSRSDFIGRPLQSVSFIIFFYYFLSKSINCSDYSIFCNRLNNNYLKIKKKKKFNSKIIIITSSAYLYTIRSTYNSVCVVCLNNKTFILLIFRFHSETNEGRNRRTRNDWGLGTESADGVDGQQRQLERKQQ